MHPTDKIEREVLLFLHSKEGMQSSQDRLMKVIQHKFKNATKAQLDKRLTFLENQGLIQDLKRYDKRKVFILTKKAKDEYPKELLIMSKRAKS